MAMSAEEGVCVAAGASTTSPSSSAVSLDMSALLVSVTVGVVVAGFWKVVASSVPSAGTMISSAAVLLDCTGSVLVTLAVSTGSSVMTGAAASLAEASLSGLVV